VSHALDRVAERAFRQVLREGRAGEFLEHLFEGGGVTFNPDGDMVWLTPDLIKRAARGPDD
jgi:hypothetical protein